MRPHRPPQQKSSCGVVVLAMLLVGGGGYLFTHLFREFRAEAEERVIEETEAQASDPVALAKVVLPEAGTTPLISAFDGAATGMVVRTPVSDQALRYTLTAFLPSIDPATEQYDVWCIREGLSDVRFAGALQFRADGSWYGEVVLGPETGYRDPLAYHDLTIMRAPQGKRDIPEGQVYVQANLNGVWSPLPDPSLSLGPDGSASSALLP